MSRYMLLATESFHNLEQLGLTSWTLGLWWRGDVSAASAGWRWRSAAAVLAALRRLSRGTSCRLRLLPAHLHHRPPRGSNTPGRRPRSERFASLAMAVFASIYLWMLVYGQFFICILFVNLQNTDLKLAFRLLKFLGVGDIYVYCVFNWVWAMEIQNYLCYVKCL